MQRCEWRIPAATESTKHGFLFLVVEEFQDRSPRAERVRIPSAFLTIQGDLNMAYHVDLNSIAHDIIAEVKDSRPSLGDVDRLATDLREILVNKFGVSSDRLA